MSDRALSSDSIFSSYSDSSTEDESAGSEAGASTEEAQTSSAENIPEDSQDGLRSPSERKSSRREQNRISKARLRRMRAGYSRLFNDASKDTEQDFNDSLPDDSQGCICVASYWSGTEQNALNKALERFGRENLPLLSSAVGTKSELEVRSYLLYLEEASLSSPITEYPAAAFEIGRSCDNMLNRAAENYAQYIYWQEIAQEKEQFGDLWLIDEFNIPQMLQLPDDEDFEMSSTEDRPLELAPTFGLFQPAAFLELSRNLFMNGPKDTKDNWRQIGKADAASSRPAIFRSAFAELHAIVMDLTRRITEASQLQALSRINAKNDERSAPHVSARDVEVACDLLGIKIDRKRYWARVARRCGVDVYSRSKIIGGDKGKIGVKLSNDEVEAELGYPADGSGYPEPPYGQSPEKDLVQSDSETPESLYSPEIDEDENGDDVENEKYSAESEESTDSDLDTIDRQASRQEEKRLRALFGFPSPAQDQDDEEEMPEPRRSKRQNAAEDSVNWRKRVKYQAEWELRRDDGGYHVGNETTSP